MRRFRAFVIAAALVGLCAEVASAQAGSSRRLSRAELENKIRGGWAGQMIGVSYGAPTEFVSNRRIIRWPITWKPEGVTNSIKQDDLYVEMTFAEVLDKVGLDATTEQFGEMFKDSKYQLWHANASARRLLNRGIKAPWSGHPKYNAHANDIDFQIESDFIGLMTPGLPQAANTFADRVGRVMNYGDGLYGGMFFSGMYAAAFFETDPRKVVEAGLASIPADSGYGKIIRDVLDWSATEPDWRKTWRKLTEKWDRDDACPDGALTEFNIDARLNGAFVALGLALRAGRLQQDARGLDALGAGLRLQPVERRRHSWRDAGLHRDSRRVEVGHSRHRGHEVRLHELHVQRDHRIHGRPRAESRRAGRRTGRRRPRSSCRSRRRRRPRSSSGTSIRRRPRCSRTAARGPGATDGRNARRGWAASSGPIAPTRRPRCSSAAPAWSSRAITTTRAGKPTCCSTARRRERSTRATCSTSMTVITGMSPA